MPPWRAGLFCVRTPSPGAETGSLLARIGGRHMGSRMFFPALRIQTSAKQAGPPNTALRAVSDGTTEAKWHILRPAFANLTMRLHVLSSLLPALGLLVLPQLAQQPAPPAIQAQRSPAAAELDAAASRVDAMARAHALLGGGQAAEAVAVLREALQRDPHSPDLLYGLAYAQLRSNDPRAALALYTQAGAERPPTATELGQVGQAYVLLNDLHDANLWTARAVSEAPRDPELWYSLGRIRYTQQRFADAAACFRHVLSLAPHNAKAENNLGLAEEGLNRTDEAVVAYQQAILWFDQESLGSAAGAQPRLNLAIVLLHRGQLDQAQHLLEQARDLHPDDPPTRAAIEEQIGKLALQQGKLDAAVAALTEAVRLSPSEGRLHFLLGQALHRLGREPQAQEQFREATRLVNATNVAVP